MKIKQTAAAFIAATVLGCSCHDDVNIINNGSGGADAEPTDVTLSLSPLVFSEEATEGSDVTTRTLSYDFEFLPDGKSGNLIPHWDTLNSVGVFPIAPDTNAQVKYTFRAERVSNLHTTYHGQGWNLKPNNTYASYYPFQDFVNTQGARSIPMSFHDQKQIRNNNFDHLDGINNIYYATAHRPEGENSISFTYKRAAGFLWVRMIAPELELPCGRLSIASYEGKKIFTDSATVDVATGEITRLKTSDRTVLHFDQLCRFINEEGWGEINVIPAGDTINLYLTMAPIGKTAAESKAGILAFELRSGTKTYYSYYYNSEMPIADHGKWFLIHPSTAMRFSVDMGLPSGTQWAECNLGALVPTDPGYYFSWGEVYPTPMYFWTVYRFNQPDNVHTDEDGIFTTGSKLWKYTIPDRQYYGCWYDERHNFIGDERRVLEPEDDAAVYQLGSYEKGSWDMPTREQFQELIDHSTFTWTENYRESGVNGYLCTSNVNGKSIFFPAAGYMGMENEMDYEMSQQTYMDDDGILIQEGARGLNSDGYYWTRSLSNDYSTDAYEFKFNTYTVNNGTDDPYLAKPKPNITTTKRYVGQTIRPVFHPKK